MDRNTSAAFGIAADAKAMPPPPKRRRQPQQKDKNNDEQGKKRRKSSVTPLFMTTHQHRAVHHQPSISMEDEVPFRAPGEGGGPDRRGGRGYSAEEPPPHDTRDTRDRRGAGIGGGRGGPGGAGSGAAHEEIVSGESKPRHLPLVGSFRPPPVPTRRPLRERTHNNNTKNNTQNTQNARFTRDKNKNALTEQQKQEKSRVTYVENHKGELEIIKYQNRKRGSVVALSPDISNTLQCGVDAQGHQHQERYHQLPPDSFAEPDDNQYHELRRVQPTKRDYRRELYHLFKRDLRDWEEQERLVHLTKLQRENICLDPRLLNMDKPKFGIKEKDDGSQPAKDFFKPPGSTTPLQLVAQQLRAGVPQSGGQQSNVSLGEQGSLGSRYGLDAVNGPDNQKNMARDGDGGLTNRYSQHAGNGSDNQNNVGGANVLASYGGFVMNNSGSGAYKSPYAQNAAAGAAGHNNGGYGRNNNASAGPRTPVNQAANVANVGSGVMIAAVEAAGNNNIGYGMNASAGPRTPVNQAVNIASGVGYAAGGAVDNDNGGYRNIAPAPPRARQQPTNSYGFPNDIPLYHNQASPINQHDVRAFVNLINDEDRARGIAQLQSQTDQMLHENMARVAGAGLMGPGPMMRMGAPQYPVHNFQVQNPYEQQQSTGLGQQNSDYGQYAQAGPGQFLQPQPQVWDARAASPALFMQPRSRTLSPFPQWEDAEASSGSFAGSPHQYHPFPSGGSLERSYHEQTGLAASPAQKRAVYPDESVDQMGQDQNAFAMQDGDTEMGGLSPYRGSTEFEGVPLSPLTFPVQLPEHTSQAQQTFAQNGQLFGVGVGSGPSYAPSHGFINSGEFAGAPVFQVDTGAITFFNDWNTIPVVRRRWEANMVAQYPPRPDSLQAVPMSMPMSAQVPVGMPPMPPMSVYPPVQMGFQQQPMYGGPRHPMLPQQQFNNNNSIGDSYAGGGNEIGPSNAPYPSQAFQFNPRSPEFSPRASSVSADFEQPATSQPTRQQVIESEDTPSTFGGKQHRRRNSFEKLLYNEYLAKKALARDAQKLDSLNGRMAVDVSPKSVAESYPDAPHSASRGRSHNVIRVQRPLKGILETSPTFHPRSPGARPLAGFTQRAIHDGAPENSSASPHPLGLADMSRQQGSMAPPPRPPIISTTRPVVVTAVADESWSLVEDEEFAEDLSDDRDYGEAIVASGAEAARRQSMQPRVEDEEGSDTEMGGVGGSREA